MSKAAIIGVVVLLLLMVVGVAAYFMMSGGGDSGSTGPGPTTPPGPASPPPPTDPCAGLTDDSLASAVPVSCLRKILTDEGCTDQGTVWPGDDYDGWWRKSPQGTTKVNCDNQGTPCGAGSFGTVKRDIHLWATMTDPTHVAGCGRSA
mgnify:CR=1 FL=1